MNIGIVNRFSRFGEKNYFPGTRVIGLTGAMRSMQDVFLQKDKINAHYPFRPGLRMLKDMPREGEVFRACLFGGFGTGWGDIIVGTTVLHGMHEELKSKKFVPEIHLVVFNETYNRYASVYGLNHSDPNKFVHKVHRLCVSEDEFSTFTAYGSMEDLLLDPAFYEYEMGEYFARRYGVSGCGVQMYNADKSCPQLIAEKTSGEEKPLLLNFFASQIRSIPFKYWFDITQTLARDGWNVVLNAGREHRNAIEKFLADAKAKHKEQFKNVSIVPDCVSSPFDNLIAYSAGHVAAMVTPDTSLVHIAGMYDIPCVAIFNCVYPELRIKRYKSIVPYPIESAKKSRFYHANKAIDLIGNITEEGQAAWIQSWKSLNAEMIRIKLREAVSRASSLTTESKNS